MENKLPFGIKNKASVSTSIRGKGAVETFSNKAFYGNYFDQLLFETKADHVVNTEVLVKLDPPQGTCYFNSTAGEFQNSSDATVTFSDGDKILWVGLDTITANIDISTIDDLTHIMYTDVTIGLGAYNLSLGENQRGELNISGTGELSVLSSDGLRVKNSGVTIINSSGDIIINNNANKRIDFNAKNLKIGFPTNTQIPVTADEIELVNLNGDFCIVRNVSQIFDIETDIDAGTERSSHWYGLELSTNSQDGALILKMACDFSSVADSDVLNSLSDSAATFQTDEYSAGDEIFQTTDNTKGFIGSVLSETLLTCVDADGAALDMFPGGNETYIIRKKKATGGGEFFARVGSGFNNVSGNLDDSGYTHPEIQKRSYDGVKDFNTTVNNGTLDTIIYSQVELFQGLSPLVEHPEWYARIIIELTVTPADSSFRVALSGVSYHKTLSTQSIPVNTGTGLAEAPMQAIASSATDEIYVSYTVAAVACRLNGVVKLNKKPSFSV